MFKPFALMMISCCQSPDRPQLDEAYQFVSSYEMARCLYLTADKHYQLKRDEIRKWPPQFSEAWVETMNKRILLFQLLAQSLDESKPREVREKSFNIFKCVLDNDLFEARYLPPPFPTYK